MALIRALPQSGWTIDNDQAYGPCLVWAEADDDAKRIVRSLLTLDPTRRATALSLMWDPFLLACSRQHATTKCDSTGDITANDPRGDVLADDFHPLIKSPSFQDRREFLGTATAAFAAVVANANVAAYNGTFTVLSVTSTQITYDCGASSTDSLVAPFPTVRLAAGKRTYTVPATGLVYAVIMAAATVPQLLSLGTSSSSIPGFAPVHSTSGDTSLTGTCPSPIAHATGTASYIYAAVT